MKEQNVTRRKLLRGAMLATAAAATGFTIAATSGPAEAMAILPPADPGLPEENHNVELAHSVRRRRWRYYSRRHGRRYRYRRHGYGYYYGGWYYARPWWTFGPGIYIDL